MAEKKNGNGAATKAPKKTPAKKKAPAKKAEAPVKQSAEVQVTDKEVAELYFDVHNFVPVEPGNTFDEYIERLRPRLNIAETGRLLAYWDVGRAVDIMQSDIEKYDSNYKKEIVVGVAAELKVHRRQVNYCWQYFRKVDEEVRNKLAEFGISWTGVREMLKLEKDQITDLSSRLLGGEFDVFDLPDEVDKVWKESQDDGDDGEDDTGQDDAGDDDKGEDTIAPVTFFTEVKRETAAYKVSVEDWVENIPKALTNMANAELCTDAAFEESENLKKSLAEDFQALRTKLVELERLASTTFD
jgi:hypothetical protein